MCPHHLQVDPFDLERVSESRANFSIPRPLSSRLRPDVRDRQTSDRHHAYHRLMPPTLGTGHNNNSRVRPTIALHGRKS